MPYSSAGAVDGDDGKTATALVHQASGSEPPVPAFFPKDPYRAPLAPVAPEEPGGRPKQWWGGRRWRRYNVLVFGSAVVADLLGAALALAHSKAPLEGMLAGDLWVSVMVGLPYMVLANVCYLLGPGAEILLPDEYVDRYRRGAYAFGMCMAVAVPAACTLLFS